MSVVEERRPGEPRVREEYPHAVHVGPIGRLGHYTATHFRVVLVGWLVIAIGLGFFAPKVETRAVGGRVGDERLAVVEPRGAPVIEHESDLLVASPELFRGHFRVDCRTGCEASMDCRHRW